jgi:hypothetical protein
LSIALKGFFFSSWRWVMNNTDGLVKLLNARVIFEKPRSYRVEGETVESLKVEFWLPKSEAAVDERGDVWLPLWLLDKKQEELEENLLTSEVVR